MTMLIDSDDTGEGSTERHAHRAALLAAELQRLLGGRSVIDTVNAICLFLDGTVDAILPMEPCSQRDSIAGVLRHLAEHVDLSCPHVQEAVEQARAQKAAQAPDPVAKKPHLH